MERSLIHRSSSHPAPRDWRRRPASRWQPHCSVALRSPPSISGDCIGYLDAQRHLGLSHAHRPGGIDHQRINTGNAGVRAGQQRRDASTASAPQRPNPANSSTLAANATWARARKPLTAPPPAASARPVVPDKQPRLARRSLLKRPYRRRGNIPGAHTCGLPSQTGPVSYWRLAGGAACQEIHRSTVIGAATWRHRRTPAAFPWRGRRVDHHVDDNHNRNIVCSTAVGYLVDRYGEPDYHLVTDQTPCVAWYYLQPGFSTGDERRQFDFQHLSDPRR